MVKLTEVQTNIQNSLIQAISCGNLLEVQNMLKDSEDSNIQKILRLEWISNELRNTVLRVAIDSYNIQDQEKAIEIIELIWQKDDQRTRDFLCSTEYDSAEGGSVSTINMLRDLQGQGRTNDSNNGLVLGEVIQEMEEHKRVRDLNSNAPIVTNTTAPTTGNTTPENNDNNTTFLSKHKRKIALSVGGLCVVGAVAAYVLAYPVVALILAAAGILAGAYIGGVFEKSESPNTKSSDQVVYGCCNNAKLLN